ncbi:MAG: hypothetical protein FD174_2436 [Geobacteraceae bacterium]|nr:MAG: hypothetical protein FD174_2436 [Geobacteraceae bacterium]
MEQELQEMHTTAHARTATNVFGRMLVFSLLLHVICSTALLLPKKSGLGGTSVTYLSLDMIAPAPSTVREETAVPHEEAEVIPNPPPPASPPISELEKLQNGLQQTLAAADSKPEAVQQASMGFGITNGHFSSLADGKTLREDMREYYLTMLQRFNEKWWLDKNVTLGGVRGAVILVSIARDGSIADKNLLQSSGNQANDRALLQALEAAGPLPPLPKTYEGNYFKAPLRFVAPLNLMAPFKLG